MKNASKETFRRRYRMARCGQLGSLAFELINNRELFAFFRGIYGTTLEYRIYDRLSRPYYPTLSKELRRLVRPGDFLTVGQHEIEVLQEGK